MTKPAPTCNKCKDAGFPNVLIKFEEDGVKDDGSKKWKVLNPDGSKHEHLKAAPKQVNPPPAVTDSALLEEAKKTNQWLERLYALMAQK